MKSKGYKLYDGWSTWLTHVGYYDWNFTHNKQWTKYVFNHIEPIIFAKNMTIYLIKMTKDDYPKWLKWLKLAIDVTMFLFIINNK
jgi:hypothetical protein